jgi:Bacterial SH3 domain
MTSRSFALVLLLAPLAAWAADTAYVSDKLVVGVYATASSEGERITQLSTGDSVEVEARDQEFTQVRLSDGREGWIKSSYLSADPPASAQIPALQAELQKLRAVAQSAKGTTVDTKRISELQKALDAAKAELAARPKQPVSPAPATTVPPPTSPNLMSEDLPIEPIGADLAYRRKAWIWGALIALITFGIGFGIGWYALDRKVRLRYGGLRIF